MKRAIKRVPLLPKSGKKDILFSDLLRSEPRFEKGTLFWEFPDTHVNTYHESGPPGDHVCLFINIYFVYMYLGPVTWSLM